MQGGMQSQGVKQARRHDASIQAWRPRCACHCGRIYSALCSFAEHINELFGRLLYRISEQSKQSIFLTPANKQYSLLPQTGAQALVKRLKGDYNSNY
jgi:hypothetical protein